MWQLDISQFSLQIFCCCLFDGIAHNVQMLVHKIKSFSDRHKVIFCIEKKNPISFVNRQKHRDNNFVFLYYFFEENARNVPPCVDDGIVAQLGSQPTQRMKKNNLSCCCFFFLFSFFLLLVYLLRRWLWFLSARITVFVVEGGFFFFSLVLNCSRVEKEKEIVPTPEKNWQPYEAVIIVSDMLMSLS